MLTLTERHGGERKLSLSNANNNARRLSLLIHKVNFHYLARTAESRSWIIMVYTTSSLRDLLPFISHKWRKVKKFVNWVTMIETHSERILRTFSFFCAPTSIVRGLNYIIIANMIINNENVSTDPILDSQLLLLLLLLSSPSACVCAWLRSSSVKKEEKFSHVRRQQQQRQTRNENKTVAVIVEQRRPKEYEIVSMHGCKPSISWAFTCAHKIDDWHAICQKFVDTRVSCWKFINYPHIIRARSRDLKWETLLKINSNCCCSHETKETRSSINNSDGSSR